MANFGILIRCIGEAVASQGFKCLLGLIPFADRLYDIAHDAHELFKQRCQLREGLAQIEAAAQAPLEEVKEEVKKVVAEIRAGAGPEFADPIVEKALSGFLEQVPAAIRTASRRPADPTGRTLPANFSVKKVEDFLRLLPPRLPRFQPGNRVIENWVLSELLGVGGFAEVWKAKHAFLPNQPPAALKFCLDPDAPRFLRHEAGIMNQMMSQGHRPGVVQLRNVHLDSNPPCLEYEFINGGDLCGLMHDWLRLSVEKRVKLTFQVVLKLARIMGPLHRLDPPVVHRDLKPANVFVIRKENGRFDLKVGDFGIGACPLEGLLHKLPV